MKSCCPVFQTDQRRAGRIQRSGSLIYLYAPDAGGLATWRDVSPYGASIRLGRYLRPGRPIALRYEPFGGESDPGEIRGRIVWCRPIENGGCSFAAGIDSHLPNDGSARYAESGAACRDTDLSRDGAELAGGK